MKIFFDHIAGKLTNYDLLYSLILAQFEPREYDYALDNGWIPLSWYFTKLDGLTWINARSCRLDLSNKQFYEKNNEKESEEFMRDDPLNWKYFIYYHNNKPVAFTEFMIIDKHFITGQFAWDYQDEKLGLGTYATLYEIKWCLNNNINKYYLSYAYENASMYKTKYDGFEFWTGRKWLDDKNIYQTLCKRDSDINDLVSLNDYQEEYFKIING